MAHLIALKLGFSFLTSHSCFTKKNQSTNNSSNKRLSRELPDTAMKRQSLEDVDVPGLLDLSPISPSVGSNQRGTAFIKHITKSSTINTDLDVKTICATTGDLVSPSSIPTTFNTPPVTPLNGDSAIVVGSGNTVVNNTHNTSVYEAIKTPESVPSPTQIISLRNTSSSPPPAFADILRDTDSPGQKVGRHVFLCVTSFSMLPSLYLLFTSFAFSISVYTVVSRK